MHTLILIVYTITRLQAAVRDSHTNYFRQSLNGLKLYGKHRDRKTYKMLISVPPIRLRQKRIQIYYSVNFTLKYQKYGKNLEIYTENCKTISIKPSYGYEGL